VHSGKDDHVVVVQLAVGVIAKAQQPKKVLLISKIVSVNHKDGRKYEPDKTAPD
jgi:hypothetical protein